MLDTVLIVGGDAVQRDMTKHSISEKLKYNVVTASNNQEAIKAVLSVDILPSIMLLDMRMPKQDSLQLIRFIKSQRPDFPIIILVEYGDHSDAVEAIEAGANDFLTKPVTIERLGLSIASALRITYLCKMVRKLEKQLEMDGVNIAQPISFSVGNQAQFGRDVKIKKLRSLEEDAIRFALNVCGGSMSKAARSLGIGRSTLYRKVGELERNKNKPAHILRETQTTRPTMVMSEIEHS